MYEAIKFNYEITVFCTLYVSCKFSVSELCVGIVITQFSMQQIELLKLKLNEATSAVENGWDNESGPVATSNPSAELSDNSKEQCSGHQLGCNIDQLLRPVTGVCLHWKSLRSVSQCHCGVSFSYAQRKVI